MRKIYDNPSGTRRAILSFGRKNAKTTLSAFILLLHLVGPEAVPNSQLFSAAQSRDQAAILFHLAAKIVRMSPTLQRHVAVRESGKQLFCADLGTLYRALSAEATTAYGLSPALVVHDELGQVKGPRSELYEALETATSAQENPLSIIISTQASTANDLLSVLIDDALGGHDPKTVVSLYSAPEDADPFAEETVRLANPAFGDFQSAEEIMAMADAARRMPSREAEFRNLVLNQRVDASAPFVVASVWQANASVPEDDWFYSDIYAGLDLSETTDLTGLVMVGHRGGHFDVRCKFWVPEEGLLDRARRDRVPYDLWVNQGYLTTTPGRSVEYEIVAEQVVEEIQRLGIRKVAFDRWNMKHLRPWLVRAGMDEEEIDGIFEEFGQGFQSMSPALRELETLLLNNNISHGGNPVLTMCAANAVVARDPAGNRKLDKKNSRGRIDGMVALAMAVGSAKADIDDGGGIIEYTPGQLFA